MKNHFQTFFGNKVALNITANYEKGNFYLNFIQEKENKEWEKIIEGLNISLNLKEICEISSLMDSGKGNTSIIHKYQN